MPSKKAIAVRVDRNNGSTEAHSKEIPNSSSEPEKPPTINLFEGSKHPQRRQARKVIKSNSEDNGNESIDLDDPQFVPAKPSKPDETKPSAESFKPVMTPKSADQLQNSAKARRTVIGDATSSSPKRRRIARGKAVNYDMKYHPMDDVTRPKVAAKRRAMHHQASQAFSFDDETLTKSTRTEPVKEESEDEDDYQPTLPKKPSRRRVSDTVDESECRRSSRCRDGDGPNYSDKWHPMDDLMPPRTGRKSCVSSPRVVIESTTPASNPSHLRHEVAQTIEKANATEANHALQENVHHPGRRRSSRKTYTEEITFRNSVRHHPIDNLPRPKVPVRLHQQKSIATMVPPHDTSATLGLHPKDREVLTMTGNRVSEDVDNHVEGPIDDVDHERDSNLKTLPARSTPLLKSELALLAESAADWNEVSDFDRRLFLLQKGAPIQGDTIPLDWSVVKRILFDEGFGVTLDMINSDDGTEWVKRRYENIKLGIEAFFSAEPGPDNKKDWTILRAEGFDVFDKKEGLKYWKNTKASIVKPIEINTDSETTNAKKNGSYRIGGDSRDGNAPHEPADVDSSSTVRSNMDNNATTHGDLQDSAVAGDIQDSSDMSEQTLVELMGTNQPTSAKAPTDNDVTIAEIEELLREVGSNQKQLAKERKIGPSPQPAVETVPAKVRASRRKKRKSAADFWIFEDDDANELPQGSELVSPRTDLPVENMSSQELVHSSQHGSDSHPTPNAHRRLEHHRLPWNDTDMSGGAASHP